MVGHVGVGGDNPLRIQSMTTTRTEDTEGTVAQTLRLVQAGCEIVRITAPTEKDACNLKNIAKRLRDLGVQVPLVADIHFRPDAALEAAEHVEKVRINPGNFTDGKSFKTRDYSDQEYTDELARVEERFTPLVLKLKRWGRALRIGTNHGSLSDRILNRFGDTPEGMVESALEFVRMCQRHQYHDIILSMKSSNTRVMVTAYRLLAARMAQENMDYPFHLGVTEAGDGEDGRVKSAVGIGSLLEDGIGDTLRVSLTEEPEAEIPVAQRLVSYFPVTTQPSSGPSGHLPPRGEGNPGFPSPLGRGGGEGPEQLHFPLETHPASTSTLGTFASHESRETCVGPIFFGSGHPPRAVTRVNPQTADPSELLTLLEKQLKSGRGLPPEIIEWPVITDKDVDRLIVFRENLKFETNRLGFLISGNFHTALSRLWSVADAFVLSLDAPEEAHKIISQKKGLWLSLQDPDSLLKIPAAWQDHPGLVLTTNDLDTSALLHNIRRIASTPWVREKQIPIHIQTPPLPHEDLALKGAVLMGGLLVDKLGDSVSLHTDRGIARDLDLIANILQATGSRVTKAEFISCPSCGRTLFDLQSTTERIKRKTGHLTGVKIAIMGCIVNGPGEMADADFGYVGSGPGKINLYVGRTCLEKGIPAADADERLIELIKQHKKWKDPQ